MEEVNLDQLVIDTLNAVGSKMTEQLNDLGVSFEHGKEVNKIITELIGDAMMQWAARYGYGDDATDAITILWCVITLLKSHINYRDKSKDQ